MVSQAGKAWQSRIHSDSMFFINMQAQYGAEITRDKLAIELGTIERIA